MYVQALDAMAEIQERHEAVKDLEESLVDLHQIFLDMSVLVDAQGEMLDNIEEQVSPTACMAQKQTPLPFSVSLCTIFLLQHLKPVVLTLQCPSYSLHVPEQAMSASFNSQTSNCYIVPSAPSSLAYVLDDA